MSCDMVWSVEDSFLSGSEIGVGGWEELDVLHEPRGKTLKSPSPCLSDSHAGDTGNNNNGWVLTKKKRNRTCPADSKMQVIILFFFFPCGPCYIISDRPLNTYRLMFTRLSSSPLWLFTRPSDADEELDYLCGGPLLPAVQHQLI